MFGETLISKGIEQLQRKDAPSASKMILHSSFQKCSQSDHDTSKSEYELGAKRSLISSCGQIIRYPALISAGQSAATCCRCGHIFRQKMQCALPKAMRRHTLYASATAAIQYPFAASRRTTLSTLVSDTETSIRWPCPLISRLRNKGSTTDFHCHE